MLAQIPAANPNHVNQDLALREAHEAALGDEGNRSLRTVVFSGVPGVGKTATAIEAAHRVSGEFPDGVLFAQLDAGRDQPGLEAEILREFLVALGDRAEEIPDRVDARCARYRALTANRRLLVFLDGAVSAAQVRTLLPGDGASLVLVTESRPLSTLAAHGRVTFVELSPLEPSAARELLSRLIGVDRVDAEPVYVDELIELCDCLPIALCVAGSMLRRSRRRTAATMVERLRDERHRLGMLSRDQDLSVTTVFSTAYRLLSDSAQVCYRALGLRPRSGEVSAEAVATALGRPGYEVVEAFAELADARLVEEIIDDRVAVRGLVQLHAEQVDDRPETEREAESRRLLDYYRRRTVACGAAVAPARPWLRSLFPDLEFTAGVPFEEAVAWLRRERANLTAAVTYAFDVGEFEMVVWCCTALWPFYEREKYLDDLLAVHDLGVRAAWRLSNDALRSLMHTQIGYAHYWRQDLDAAVAEFEKGTELGRAAGTTDLEATAVEGLGLALVAQARDDEARAALRRALELAHDIGDPRRIALARFHLAKAEKPDIALALLDEAERAFAELPGEESENLAKVGTWRGRKLIEQGRYAQAREPLAQALDTMVARRRRFDVADIVVALADAADGLGEIAHALERYREALVAYEQLGFSAPAKRIRDKIRQCEQRA
jgi:tetratricopeptide (TPR) repeat protein